MSKPSTPEHVLLVGAYDAFNARAIDTVLAMMQPDVRWANGMDGGYVRGQDAVREYWKRQWTMINPHVEPRGFAMEPDGSVVVQVHQIVRDLAGNVTVDQMVQHVYCFQDGLIKSMEIRN